jgi:hypothetical protein
MDDFEERVAKAHETVAPDMSQIPTADQILNGVAILPSALTFDQQWVLVRDLADELGVCWQRSGKQFNILIDSKLDCLAQALQPLQMELRLFLLTEVLTVGVPIERNTKCATFIKGMEDVFDEDHRRVWGSIFKVADEKSTNGE